MGRDFESGPRLVKSNSHLRSSRLSFCRDLSARWTVQGGGPFDEFVEHFDFRQRF